MCVPSSCFATLHAALSIALDLAGQEHVRGFSLNSLFLTDLNSLPGAGAAPEQGEGAGAAARGAQLLKEGLHAGQLDAPLDDHLRTRAHTASCAHSPCPSGFAVILSTLEPGRSAQPLPLPPPHAQRRKVEHAGAIEWLQVACGGFLTLGGHPGGKAAVHCAFVAIRTLRPEMRDGTSAIPPA